MDPIIEEVRKARFKHAERFNFDLHAICADLREKEKSCTNLKIILPVKKISKQEIITEAGTK